MKTKANICKGGNTCMILEEPQIDRTDRGGDFRSHYIDVISAKTASSLAEDKGALRRYLIANPRIKIQDIAYTTTSRRLHHTLRTAYSVGNIIDLIENLSADIFSTTTVIKSVDIAQIVFTFPGQGSRFAGMGAQLFDSCPVFRNKLLELNSTCIRLGFPPFLPSGY